MHTVAHEPTQSNNAPGALGEPFIVMSNITKRFAGALALDNITVDLRAGEIHSMIGANGAGKSTLGKLLSGVHTHDGGEIRVRGEVVTFHSPADALSHGIAIMQQEIALAGKLSVIDNVFLGTEFGTGPFVRRREQYGEFERLRQRSGFHLDPDTIVDDLRLGEQQQVSVLWALARHAQLVVMDEPTASLDREDARRLLATARMLADDGITVVFVSHFLEDVLEISDRITVLANGTHVLTADRADLEVDDLVRAMIGGSLDAAFPPLPPEPAADADPVFEATDIRVNTVLHGVSLSVRAGEIVGIFGLVGSGRSEFAHAITGAMRDVQGTIQLNGLPQRITTPKASIAAGITLLPESRKDQGLMLGRSVRDNTALSALSRFTSRLGIVRQRELEAAVVEALSPLALRGGNRLDEEVGNFSGGNQQKVLLAKCLLTQPKLLILDEPTRGVDIGAKRAIYDVIAEIAALGTAIILISSDEAEVMHLSHRIEVFRNGAVVDRVTHREATKDGLLAAALGAHAVTQTAENGK